MKRSLLIVGIDGGTWNVLRPVMERGHMPFFADIVHRGTQGVLKSTIPAITPVAWSAFQTGLNPGNLGIYGWMKWKRGEDKPGIADTSPIGSTLWEICSDNDLTVASINVPMTYPPRPVNGCMVSGLLAPSIESEFTYPPDLKQRLLDAVPDYDFFRESNAPDTVGRSALGVFLDEMSEMARARSAGAQFIMRAGAPWDLFMVHFLVTDYVEHRVWNYLDENHPAHDAAAFDDICRKFFRPLDAEIASIWSQFEQSAAGEPGVLFLSDHGQQANMRSFNLMGWLLEEGLLQLHEAGSRDGSTLDTILRWGDPLRLRRLIPKRIRQRTAHGMGLRDWFHYVDWQNTHAIAFQGLTEAGLHILADGDDASYDAMRARIVKRLKGLKDSSTGAAVVRAVHRREDIWEGRLLSEMPDLVVELEDGYSFAFDRHENAPMFRDIVPGEDKHVGTHHRDGIIAAAGPGFQAVSDLSCELIDLAPTILHYLGLPAAADFDGHVISAMLDYAEGHPLTAAEATEKAGPAPTQNRTEADEEAVKQRLRDLGYL